MLNELIHSISKHLLTLSLFLSITNTLSAQVREWSAEELRANGITQIKASLDLANDDSLYEGLEVANFQFDEKGRCIKEVTLYPFFDVVASTVAYERTYNELGDLVKQVRLEESVGISQQGKEYIALFGGNSDTMVILKTYNNRRQPIRTVEYHPGSNDSLIVEYEYTDSLLAKTTHFSTNLRDHEKSSKNFDKTYFYDANRRLVKVKQTYNPSGMYFFRTVEYAEGTDLISRTVERNKPRWSLIMHDGNVIEQPYQLMSYGSINENWYNKAGQLVKEITYVDPVDTTSNFYGREFTYDSGKRVSEQTFSQTDDVIQVNDRTDYRYNDLGLLKEERFYYDDKWNRSRIYEYSSEKK
ncbi:MAG: hypothetical protein JJ975_04935 [Bacteroidia bacterium]|nr:hypothetical protein [Bacteroidia bacterium]